MLAKPLGACGVLGIRRRFGACGCCWRGRRRRRRSATDVVLYGRSNVGYVADEYVIYKRRFDLRAQRGKIRSPSTTPGYLHSEERTRKVRNNSLIRTDDSGAQARGSELNRSKGANLLLDSGPINSDAADLIQRSRIDDTAELGLVARI